jgi:hypothetical protein
MQYGSRVPTGRVASACLTQSGGAFFAGEQTAQW